MKCYVCAESGETKDAVAVCVVCGMGLCKEHAHRSDVPIRGREWAPQQTTMIILCETCLKALSPST